MGTAVLLYEYSWSLGAHEAVHGKLRGGEVVFSKDVLDDGNIKTQHIEPPASVLNEMFQTVRTVLLSHQDALVATVAMTTTTTTTTLPDIAAVVEPTATVPSFEFAVTSIPTTKTTLTTAAVTTRAATTTATITTTTRATPTTTTTTATTTTLTTLGAVAEAFASTETTTTTTMVATTTVGPPTTQAVPRAKATATQSAIVLSDAASTSTTSAESKVSTEAERPGSGLAVRSTNLTSLEPTSLSRTGLPAASSTAPSAWASSTTVATASTATTSAAPPLTPAPTPSPAPGEEQLRYSLGEWLVNVATLQQVEAMATLNAWLESAEFAAVNASLLKLTSHDDSSKWVTCAVEDETCDCPSGKIRYGHVEKQWISSEGKTSVRCSLQVFKKDVAVGMLKQCQCFSPTDLDAGRTELIESAKLVDTKKRKKPKKMSDISDQAVPALQSRDSKPPGSLWQLIDKLVNWIHQAATFQQLLLVAKVYKWLESSRSSSRVGVALAKAAAPSMPHRGPCSEGSREQNARRCAGHGEYGCRASCSRRRQPAEKKPPVPRAELCNGMQHQELLWSCDRDVSRNPKPGHRHEEMQKVLDSSVQGLCKEGKVRDHLAVHLDCEFLQSYLRWTTDESEWLEEAYVTYVGGKKDSTYEWQATNLVRSIDLFSSRPIVVVVFGDEFPPPLSWHRMPNVIVFKMLPIRRGVSFNFNKIRAMISARVVVGIQLDTDQIIAAGMDQVFESTRREITAKHPWPMMPVHWMSRDAKRPEPYWEYAFHDWNEKRTMRWGHAHPSWSYWALLFLCDLLHERLLAALKYSAQLQVWDLSAAKDKGVLSVLASNTKKNRKVQYRPFMREDEDMLNVALWRDDVYKQWCKFDLEWGLYRQGYSLDRRLYYDPKWYPDGIPVIFVSMHNTKRFEETDSLLSLLARCDKQRFKINCPSSRHTPRFCKEYSAEERLLRRQLQGYGSQMCCCVQPRLDTHIYWAGHWFNDSSKVPLRLPHIRQDRTCVVP